MAAATAVTAAARRTRTVRHDGRTLIDYAESAKLLGKTNQYLRKLQAAHHGPKAKAAGRRRKPNDMPPRLKGPGNKLVFFDFAAMVRWGVVRGWLNPDGTRKAG